MHDLIGDRTLRDLLDERTARTPEKTYLVYEDAEGTITEFSYLDFSRRVDELAAGLAALGVGKGDRVTIHLRNSPEVLEAWFALATLGAVFVPSNVANTAGEIQHVVSYSGSVAVITQPLFADVVARAVAECPTVRHTLMARTDTAPEGTLLLDDQRLAGATPPDNGVGPDDVVEMIFTSGTTARPKGVLLTHANALHSGERSSRALLLDSSERCLTSLPVFHVNAQSLTVLSSLTVGGTAIVLEEYRATKFWDQVRAHKATQISLVAMQARTLLAQPPRDTDDQHDVRRVFYALNITTDERDSFEKRYGVELVNGYGLSEAMTLVTVAPVFGPKRWPSIGVPLHDRVVKLVDAEGNEVPRGEVGEIVVQGRPGRTLMLGYHNDPEATARTLVDGWLHTGDNAYVDEKGYFYFFDRGKDMIKRAGENVSTVEVESVLLDHPEIVEAAVIGVVDPIRDEAVKAFVALAAGSTLTVEAIQEHCATRLARFKVPTIVEIRDELPKTSIGKIEKKLLRGQG
ncbi:Long-chain-fatty-acid--CoA ligase [Pseudonocardia dioxanivorans CB1190]|uniref:Long-chain-fatty-acid--CoA ligase n=1 Tax=Pseudonocardia dioxanivorans (strain ATCC 55486 / DSM 44775 / JCM 13855 / CB1190) TaxID=675635 RepID=F4CZ11_PSEUX|nr:AMP-binding protein [Pseudonocardia dioxanivorans]AEA24302.1 Long-chain-fatty-acid--CoA ligase [Pseudonocardia dioxanivorans CB1190]GJF02131.1 putative crotonobetaine/carnitine-CoA ligase [Pseudonocardia sp. D17]